MTESKPFDYNSHVRLWLWLAENPTKNKMEWPGWKEDHFGEHSTSTHMFNHCFACAHAHVILCSSRCKRDCPLDWRSASRFHSCYERGLYDRWIKLFLQAPTPKNLRLRSELARKIAFVPVKLGIPYIPYILEEGNDASLALANASDITE